MGVLSWGFLQNTSPHHQRHPVKKWISLKCHFFQHVNLGKSCRGPCNSLPSALPHLPRFSTACVSSQHLVKGNPKRQEWGKSAVQQPVPGTSCHFYTHTHTHTHTRKWGASPYKSVLRPWEDSYKSTKSERTLEIGQTPAHCFHSQDTHVFAWILLGHKAARLTREPAQYVCFLCSLDTAFPFCDGVQSILAASQVCNLTPSVAKDFKVKSHRNPTHCEHCSAEHRPDVCWLRWPEYRSHGKGSLGMEGKRGWASRKKGEDLKLEEDNEQHRDISRYKCRKTLSLLSIVT